MTAISDPDLGHHRLHHGLPFRQGTVTYRSLDVADELRELGRVRDARLTLRYLLGQFGAPGLERGQLRRQFLDPPSADLLAKPPLLESLEVAGPLRR